MQDLHVGKREKTAFIVRIARTPALLKMVHPTGITFKINYENLYLKSAFLFLQNDL
jgi:hypothetical protein